jgi:hypothetical protein
MGGNGHQTIYDDDNSKDISLIQVPSGKTTKSNAPSTSLLFLRSGNHLRVSNWIFYQNYHNSFFYIKIYVYFL